MRARADAHDDVDAVGDHAVRQLRQTRNLDPAGIDVGQLAGIDVVEVVVRLGVGIVEHLVGLMS